MPNPEIKCKGFEQFPTLVLQAEFKEPHSSQENILESKPPIQDSIFKYYFPSIPGMESLLIKLHMAFKQRILFSISRSVNKFNKKWLTLNPII
jgi:hypothetical protein